MEYYPEFDKLKNRRLKYGPGVYKITIGSDMYIGATHNLHQRMLNHLSCLRTQKHPSKLMQRRYNELSKDVFNFEVLEVGYGTKTKEHEYIKKYKPSMNTILLKSHSK